MKSTPINQLPSNGANRSNDKLHHDTITMVKQYEDTQKAQDNFKPPIDTSVSMNIDDDISLNEVMSGTNDNRNIELNETARLQEQINKLQTEIQKQREQNELRTLDHLTESAPGLTGGGGDTEPMVNPIFVPQSPSAHLINQEALATIAAMKANLQSASLGVPDQNAKKRGYFGWLWGWFGGGSGMGGMGGGSIVRIYDLKLLTTVFLVALAMYSTTTNNFIEKYIKDSKYAFLKEPSKAMVVAIVVMVFLRF